MISAATIEALDLPFTEAVEFFRGKLNRPSAYWADLWQEAHTRAFTVSGATSEALLEDFRAEILKALEQGSTKADFLQRFNDLVTKHGWDHRGPPGWRANIIYETNLSMAYAAGRHEQMTEEETLAAFPFWQYVHSGALHPRLDHLGWNGLTLRANHGWWKTHYPPNGWRCGCRAEPLSESDLRRQGKAGPDEAPPLMPRPWVNPKTGEVHQVPQGIDPGFAYNVGEAWKSGRVSSFHCQMIE